MGYAAGGVVRGRAAERLLGDVLMRHGLDDVGAGDEHVAGLVDHKDEVSERRRIDRAARARTHDGGDLRDHAARKRIAQEDIGVARERQHAFLDARAAGIVQADDGRAGLERQVHNLDDLLGVGFRERTAEDREVLREHVGGTAVDQAVAGDEAVAVDDLFLHAEVVAMVTNQLVGFLEGAFVEQQIDAFARGELAFGVLACAALVSTARFGAPRGGAAILPCGLTLQVVD